MYKALKSFSGLVSMRKGEVREISDLAISNDLLKAGYIEEIGSKKEPKTEPETKKAGKKKSE
jgi:hypothetical protein